MALLLNVPFNEKDEAKKLGARWNPELKKWYVQNKSDYPKFVRWISENGNFEIICDCLYIVEGKNTCFKCGKTTRVIGYGIENYYEFWNMGDSDKDHYYESGEVHIASHIKPMPAALMEYIQSQYNYKKRYSKTIKSSYLANCCDNCDVLQGDFFLFEEVDSPFFIYDKDVASKLKLYKIPLKYDLVLDTVEVGIGSNDYLIKENAEIINLDISRKRN
ncbi:DUF5710 domain-containing protein [Clostridium sp. Marseille-P2415]|uniref:DUF5710 domain-containing protein n=1 Tax=Clostridium sp. Marseille-P2415 TaxID=1805471 RepID=UPI00098847A0|nr:DUF5710 domain-containing protein [Clostridium sp. Marseille-P2415]